MTKSNIGEQCQYNSAKRSHYQT